MDQRNVCPGDASCYYDSAENVSKCCVPDQSKLLSSYEHANDLERIDPYTDVEQHLLST